MWREIFDNKPLPIVPGKKAVNINEVNRALLDDTSDFQKRKMAALQGRGPTASPEPTQTLTKRWFGQVIISKDLGACKLTVDFSAFQADSISSTLIVRKSSAFYNFKRSKDWLYK